MANPNFAVELPKVVDKHISDICDCSYTNDTDNHCAHFVSHFMSYRFGFKCKDMSGKGTGAGANIRVHEVFGRCAAVGLWGDKPDEDCLAFVTASTNVDLANKTMKNVPAKHIGISFGGKIYHYSNSKRKVVAASPEDFAKHYPGSNITVYFGSFPDSQFA